MTTTGNWRASSYSYAAARELGHQLELSHVTAAVLARRGLADPVAARAFLAADEEHDPFEFDGMREAAGLVLRHIRAPGAIAIHGDYDVDGVCSTALLVRCIRALGGNVMPRLPSRAEGYGLSPATVEELHARGATLLITVDCGIGAAAEVALAQRLGMEVLVTDHHRPPPELPPCSIVHPVLCGYPCEDLCATAVAYKLGQALYRLAGQDEGTLGEDLDLVGLATIADVVPLVGENRSLARRGLHALAGTAKPGLRALMRVAAVEPQAVREQSVAFGLAPRINAAGRLYRADAALELLLTEDDGRALEVARELDAVNSERQAVETQILFEAEGQITPERRSEPLFVLAGEDWHAGVIGIVASRLVERHHRPCVLVALDRDGRGRGSGRSISAYDLHAGLAACAGHLSRFGGHRMAAGLELERSQLDDFRSDMVAHAAASLTPADLVPVERVDAVVPGDAVGLHLAEELDLLRPFGMGNPGVNLLFPAARLADVRPMGEGRHARFKVVAAGVRTSAVAFGVNGDRPSGDQSERRDLIARLEANEWRGAVEPRLVVRSLAEAGCEGGDNVDGGGCHRCTCQARGREWWEGLWREFDSPDALAAQPISDAPPRTVVDERGAGIAGVLGDLLSTRESLAVVCADCSRRRALLGRELDGSRFGRSPALVLSVRCSARQLEKRAAEIAAGSIALLDYETIGDRPHLLTGFTHVFALDPPPLERFATLLRKSETDCGPAFLHLGWGGAEVDFALQAVEEQYGLRGPLAAVFKALAAASEGVADDQLAELLAGSSRHPRSPRLAGRCLRILVELGLADLQRSSATVKCTIISTDRVELERSPSFKGWAALHREALTFLSEQAQPAKRAKAA